MARLEYKYLVSNQHLDSLRKDLAPFLEYDKFAAAQPNKEYTVRSIYFDTLDLKCYYEKLSGVKERNKFRVRGYNEPQGNDTVFVEIKRKSIDYISKDRVKILFSQLDAYLNNDMDSEIFDEFSTEQNNFEMPTNFLYYYHMHQLKPKTLVTYEREAFECRFGSNLRVTFDKNLRTARSNKLDELFNNSFDDYPLMNSFILEVKYYKALPFWIPEIINKYHLQRQSLSKYAFSVDESILRTKTLNKIKRAY
jgi:SPX domain protein involved in polyphosphate accumulation